MKQLTSRSPVPLNTAGVLAAHKPASGGLALVLRRLALAAVYSAAVLTAFGQNPVEVTPQTPSPEGTPAQAAGGFSWTKAGLDFYLLGDGYASLNFNHPANGVNQLYNFDVKANQAHLSMAKFGMEKPSGVLGFRVDVGAGNAFDLISASDKAPEAMKYLEQVFVELRPKQMHGVQLDFGKFASSAGAEVIDTNNNWNYSRSLLFVWAVPYYHLGLRATIPVSKLFTTGVQVVNGWNNVKDNNHGKTVGLVANFTSKKATWSNTYYTGPEKDNTDAGFRQLYDSVLLVNASTRAGFYLNFDYGTDKNVGPGRKNWSGVAAAARYQLTSRFAVAPRAEVFRDANGLLTGTRQTLREITVTGEMKMHENVLSRLEFRRDRSNAPFFNRGANQAFAREQSTVTLGILVFFGPKKS